MKKAYLTAAAAAALDETARAPVNFLIAHFCGNTVQVWHL
jgi:hypothetical protein